MIGAQMVTKPDDTKDDDKAPQAAPPATAPVDSGPSSAQDNAPPAKAEKPQEPSVADILARPEVAAEIARARRDAAEKAAEKARKDALAEAEEKAKREKMDEVARLRLEVKEAAEKAAKAEAAAIEAAMERDLAAELVKAGRKLTDPKAYEYIRFRVLQEVDATAPGKSVGETVSKVIEDSPWLFQQPAAAPESVMAPPKQPATASPERATATKPQTKPTEAVDTMRMTRQEFAEYKRRMHGIH